MARRLILIGSGENAPTMVTNHQRWLESVPKREGAAVALDTPYGFQEGADALTGKFETYFRESVGRQVASLRLRSPVDHDDQVRSRVANANWVFAGPGSPSYALDVWQQIGLAADFESVLARGTVVLASAAAITAGNKALPVYEIYKVGQAPQWLTGLGLLEAATGLRAAVIPHYNNAEGGAHDTRYCYIGARRLGELEQSLELDEFILGIDEHTALAFDLSAQTFEVVGRGAVTVRKHSVEVTFAAGARGAVSELAAVAEAAVVDVRVQEEEVALAPEVAVTKPVDAFVDQLLALRASARAEKRFADSDSIRDFLLSQGVVVEDSAGGSTWHWQDGA